MNTFTTLLKRVKKKSSGIEDLSTALQEFLFFSPCIYYSSCLCSHTYFSLLSPFYPHFCPYYPHILLLFTPLKPRHWSPFKVKGLFPSCVILLCPAVCSFWLLAFPLCCCFRAEMSSGGGVVRKAAASSYQGTRLLKIWRDLHMSTVQLPVGLRLPKSPRDLCRDCWLLLSVEVSQVCSLSASSLHLELQEADNGFGFFSCETSWSKPY